MEVSFHCRVSLHGGLGVYLNPQWQSRLLTRGVPIGESLCGFSCDCDVPILENLIATQKELFGLNRWFSLFSALSAPSFCQLQNALFPSQVCLLQLRGLSSPTRRSHSLVDWSHPGALQPLHCNLPLLVRFRILHCIVWWSHVTLPCHTPTIPISDRPEPISHRQCSYLSTSKNGSSRQ